MSKIEEMALKAYPKLIFKPAVEVVSSIDEKPTRIDCNEAKRKVYKEGANAVLEQIENFMKGLDLGNSAEEKFYKLGILADIHRFIQKLKEQ